MSPRLGLQKYTISHQDIVMKRYSGSLHHIMYKDGYDMMPLVITASRLARMLSERRVTSAWSRVEESTMDTHSVVCWARRRALHRERPRRCRCKEHHLLNLIITGTSRRPPYRQRDVGRGECKLIRCCSDESEITTSRDHTSAVAVAVAATAVTVTVHRGAQEHGW